MAKKIEGPGSVVAAYKFKDHFDSLLDPVHNLIIPIIVSQISLLNFYILFSNREIFYDENLFIFLKRQLLATLIMVELWAPPPPPFLLFRRAE